MPPSPPSAGTAAEVAAGLATTSPLSSGAGVRPASQDSLLAATPAANASLGTPAASAAPPPEGCAARHCMSWQRKVRAGLSALLTISAQLTCVMQRQVLT